MVGLSSLCIEVLTSLWIEPMFPTNNSSSAGPCCRFHPAKVNSRIGQFSAGHSAFALRMQAQPSGIFTFEATTRVHFCYGPVTRNLPWGGLVDRLRRFCFHLLRQTAAETNDFKGLDETDPSLKPSREHAGMRHFLTFRTEAERVYVEAEGYRISDLLH
jgi:hypothetical protein